MDSKKTLEFELSDVNEKTLKLSLFDPKDNITKEDIVNFEQIITANQVFLGPTGNIEKISKAYIREISIKNLI